MKLNPKELDTLPLLKFVPAFALMFLPASLLAQDATNAPTQMQPTVVTGSLIPTAETVGVAPIDVIGSQEIRETGTQDILTTLKILNPAFTGNGNVGQSLNNGGYGEAYISLRNLPTLVLIDGQRLNITPFSTFVGTYAADVNTIPISMIDRIEVLKDGASTIYGSDAVGGVVNIITKHAFNGAQIDLHYGFGMDKGAYNEDRFSAVVGYDKNGTRIVAGGQYYYSDPIYTQDRAVGSLSAQQLSALGLHAPAYFSGSFPGRVGDVTVPGPAMVLAGSPLAVGAPGYRAGVTTPPIISGGPYTSVADYNAAAQVQLGYTPYIPISSTPPSVALGGSPTILNTALLKTVSLMEQDRRTGFANIEQDIFEDHLTLYGQLLYSHNESEGALAPAPIPSLNVYNLSVPANNPYNPFGIALGAGGSDSPQIRSRLLQTGNRAFDTTSDFWHFVAGLKGNVFEKFHYDVSADYSQTTESQLQNSASSILLNEAMTPSAGNPYVSTLTSHGTPLPTYNIFSVTTNDSQTVKAIKASSPQGGFSNLFNTEGVFRGEIFDLPAGPFELAAGGQYIHEKLDTTAGSLLQSGNLIGLLALPPFSGGQREREAGFVEANIPVFNPDMHVPLMHSFEINASGRYETISSLNNSHDSLVPKVGFRWQPFDEQLTIRGTYSQGFVVPPLTQLYGPPLNTTPYVVAPAGGGSSVPQATQENANLISNPDIPPATAETMTIGVVYTPKQIKGLTVSGDYYHIEEPNVSFNPSPSAIISDLNARGTSSIYYNNPALHGTPIYTDLNGTAYGPATGQINNANFGTVNIPLIPGGSQRTEGIDLSANYRLATEHAGVWNFFVNANISLVYDVRLPGSGYVSYNGQYTDLQVVGAAQGLIPDYNLTAGLTYSFFNFDYTVIAHYLPGATDLGDMHASVGAPSNDFTANGKPWQISDYYKVDMQLAYNIRSNSRNKWYDGTRLAVGVNNVTDNMPPLIASSSEDNTDKADYDIIGRFVYFEISKKF